MQQEDKLTHDERVRLECIAQAINYWAAQKTSQPISQVLKVADVFEAFILNGLPGKGEL